jgi:hypothetical protein
MTHLIASIIISQVLRDSFLADASTTVMIAHVAPANCTSESALNTLRYAERLKAVATGSTASTASISVASPANGTASAASAASAASPAGAPPAVRTSMPYALAGAESGLPPPPASPARRPPRTPLPLPPASPARRATEGQAGLRSAVPSSPKVFKPAAAASPAGRTAGAVAALNAYMDASSAGCCSAVDASSAGSAAASAVDVCRDLLRVAYDADGWKQELSYLDALATRPGGVEVGRYFDRLETVMSERLQLLHALQARVPQLRAHYCGDALDASR